MRRVRRLASGVMGFLLVASLVSSVGSAAIASHPADAGATVESTELVFGGDEVTLEAGPGQVVRGETDLPAGTRLAVRVTKTSSSPRFILSEEAVVAPDGTFRATFDMADVPVGADVDVSVTRAGTELVSATARTVECTEACAAPDPETPAATLSLGGATGSLEAGPGRVVTGETNLPPGAELTVRMQRTDDGSPDFIFSETATVGEDGRFRTLFNLTDVSGAEVHATVTHEGSEVANASGAVAPCQTRCEMPPESESASGESADRNYTRFDDLSGPNVSQGDVARFELTFESEEATLTVGGPTVSYALNLSVRDGDGDDRVVVLFATDSVGHGDDAVTVVDDDDSVSVIDERVDGDRDVLDEGHYPIRRSNGPLSTTPTDNASTFVVEHGVFVVRDAPMDEHGDEPVVEEPGLPRQMTDEGYEEAKPIRVRMNETVEVPIRTDESKAVTAIFGAYDSPYTLSTVVADGNGDERVTLVLDTTAAHEGSQTPAVTTAAEDDSVVVTYQNGSMAPATYEVTLYRRPGMPDSTDWNDSHSHAGDVFGHGKLVVSESNSTPTLDPSPTQQSERTSGSELPTSLGVLALGGVVASVGLAFLTGVLEL